MLLAFFLVSNITFSNVTCKTILFYSVIYTNCLNYFQSSSLNPVKCHTYCFMFFAKHILQSNVNFITHDCYNPFDMSSIIVWIELLRFCGSQGYQDSGHLSPHQRIMVPDGVWSMSCDSPQHLSACCGQFSTSCEHLSEFNGLSLFSVPSQ